MDIVKIITPKFISGGRFYNDFIVDFIFGAIIGIGAYLFRHRVYAGMGVTSQGNGTFGCFGKRNSKLKQMKSALGLIYALKPALWE